jgi:hypothetical protein
VANTFCKLEMGVSIPPKLHAKAKPSNKALENLQKSNESTTLGMHLPVFSSHLDSVGKSRTIGKIMDEHNIGAV